MTDNTSYIKAKKRVEAKLGFYIHLAIYIAVMTLLVVINLTTAPDPFWAIWPLIGWGIAVLAHGLSVFVLTGKTTDLKKKMIEKEIQKEKGE